MPPREPFLLLANYEKGKSCDGIVLMQVEDTETARAKEFHDSDCKAANRFDNHGAKFLCNDPI